MKTQANAVVLVVEGLGLGLVGAYGSSTAATPALDRLAAQGLVLDQCFVDALTLRQQLESLWTGQHAAMRSGEQAAVESSLWTLLAGHAVPARLITDCPEAAAVAQALGCEHVVLVEIAQRTELAEEPEKCALVDVFSAAIAELSDPAARGVLWVHSQGLRLPWDAPKTLRIQMIDPDDPEPPLELCAPRLQVDKNTDPDIVVGWGQVAAAQAAVVDLSIESLVQAVELREDADRWSWMVTSLGGYPLGEHGQIGWRHRQVYGEEISIPAIVRQSHCANPGARRGELCQLPDLFAVLLECLGLKSERPIWGRSLLSAPAPTVPQAWPVEHTIAWLEHAQTIWLRTPAWSLISHPPSPPKLFVKPDDRWEVVDVSSRSTEVVERLLQLVDEAKRTTLAGDRSGLPKLEPALCDLIR